ncbi:MAG: thioredoxin family protein [Alloprevotella sp.]
MKNIKVLMSGCKCSQKFYELVVKTVNEHGIDARVEKVDDIMEVMQYNTMTLPALVVDGEVVARGQKNESELLSLLA